MGFCCRSMFCCELLCVHSCFEIISMGKRESVALLIFLVPRVVWLFLAMPRACLQVLMEVFPDHTHLLFWTSGQGRDVL